MSAWSPRGPATPTYRAGIAAGLLTAAGRDDIPIGFGQPTGTSGGPPRPQGAFARESGLDRYRGTVADDGARAIVDCVANSAEPVTIVAIGPVTNIAAALERQSLIFLREASDSLPDIATNVSFTGTSQSPPTGHGTTH